MKTQWKARKASRRGIFSFSIELRVPWSVSLWQRRAGVATSRQSRTPSGPLCWSFSPCRPSPLRREDSWDRNISLRSDSVLSRHSTSWSWRDRGTGPAMSSPSAPSSRRREIEILWRAGLETSPIVETWPGSLMWRTVPPSVSSSGQTKPSLGPRRRWLWRDPSIPSENAAREKLLSLTISTTDKLSWLFR